MKGEYASFQYQVQRCYWLVQPGVVGVCKVVREAYPDSTAQDPKSPKYDPKSTAENPRWFMVDVKLVSPHSMVQSHILASFWGHLVLPRSAGMAWQLCASDLEGCQLLHPGAACHCYEPYQKDTDWQILSLVGVKAPLGGACLAQKSSQYGTQSPHMGMSVMCGAAGTEAATYHPSAGA